MPNTTTCDNCGHRYEFTNYRKDRCPICCPKDEPEYSEYFNQDEWDDDLTEDSG